MERIEAKNMFSKTVWKLAQRPNYATNVDKVFPYSEVPYLGEFDLIKIPISLNKLIQHVDYWGEGKVVSENGSTGFTNCYNVNHQYQLVSKGVDRDRKIPNRIPVVSYTNCDTSAYIKNDSVITVTVSGELILNSSCSKDIARIVNSDFGTVVVFGLDYNSHEIKTLEVELRNKGFFYTPDYDLPKELKDLSVFSRQVAFLNKNMLKDEIYKHIINSSINNAVMLSKPLNQDEGGAVISEVVNKIIRESKKTGSLNLMAYAYGLWHGDAKDIVINYFPEAFKLIFNSDSVTIVNKQYHQALKLDANTDSYNDRLAWGDQSDKTSKRVSWKIISEWNNNCLTFKLFNTDCNMYLKLDANVDDIGDRKGWGSFNSNEDRHKYHLQPVIENEILVFVIINYKYQQGLKLAMNADSYGDRLLWGHNGSLDESNENLRWIIKAW